MTMTEEPFVGWEWVTEIYEGYPTLQIAPTLFNFDGIKSQTARMDPTRESPLESVLVFRLKACFAGGNLHVPRMCLTKATNPS